MLFVLFGMLTILAPPAGVLLLLGVAMMAVCALGSLLVHVYRGATHVKDALLMAMQRGHPAPAQVHVRARHIH